MRFWPLLCVVLACGGSSEEDEVLERELEAEATAGDEEHELTIADRFRAAETRVFEACYDELTHLDDAHRRRRELRVRRLNESQVSDESPAGVSVQREGEDADETTELPSNVDDETHAYSAEERELIRLENELDVFHGQHADPNVWTDAELNTYEDLADGLVSHCEAMRG